MATLTIAVAIYTITIKSQIAVDQRAIANLSKKIQSEEALSEVLRAEWARLQRRDTIEALGVSRFGPAVAETAQEINVRDLAPRSTTGNGRAQALALFQNAVSDLALGSADQTLPALDPSGHSLRDGDPIADCLQGRACPWTEE